MADILSDARKTMEKSELSPGDERFIACAELLFFAYRDFTAGPDAVLEDYRFGRAHHRVLHFVFRNPGLRVAQLLDILRITKQSLARVLKQLIDTGFIEQRAGPNDRRERRLFATDAGKALAEKLTNLQVKRLKQALNAAGPDAEETVRTFLLEMISENQRQDVEQLVTANGSKKKAKT